MIRLIALLLVSSLAHAQAMPVPGAPGCYYVQVCDWVPNGTIFPEYVCRLVPVCQ